MDRDITLEHLAEAERRISQSEQHLARQREVLLWLERRGHDTTHARRLLAELQEVHAIFLAQRDRLLNVLHEFEEGQAEVKV